MNQEIMDQIAELKRQLTSQSDLITALLIVFTGLCVHALMSMIAVTKLQRTVRKLKKDLEYEIDLPCEDEG